MLVTRVKINAGHNSTAADNILITFYREIKA